MQTATYRPSPVPSQLAQTSTTADPVRASVAHLLSRAHEIPCTAAAQAFNQLVQPAVRFGIALDILLPVLSGRTETPRRILAVYILYFMYASHPVTMNPFRSAFAEVFLREREVSRVESERGSVSENEQLVWVLWKVLKGDGEDLGPYSPTTLSRSPLPPKLRASQLTIDDSITLEDDDLHDSYNSEKSSLSPIATNGLSSTPSISRTPVDTGSGMRASPVVTGEESVRELVDQGIHLLLAACQRVLTLSEQRIVVLVLPHFAPQGVIALQSLPSLLNLNPALGHPLIVSLLSTTAGTTSGPQLPRADVLEVIRQLPPVLPSFDILGRLLRDPTLIASSSNDYDANQINGMPKTTVADLIRTEVLGGFVLNAIGWVERSEKSAAEGFINDDRVAKGVQNLCRFYNSLIKLGIVDPKSDVDSAEMAHFALAHARFEDANSLYRVLAMGKF